MKRQLGLLLACALLVLSLAACGGDKDTQQDDGRDQTHDTILDDAEDALDDTKDALEDAGDDIRDDVEDAGDDIRNDTEDREEHRDEDTDKAQQDGGSEGRAEDKSPGAAADSTGAAKRRTGLDLMLHNARVHDSDGFLKDGENPVTPGAAL